MNALLVIAAVEVVGTITLTVLVAAVTGSIRLVRLPAPGPELLDVRCDYCTRSMTGVAVVGDTPALVCPVHAEHLDRAS